MAGCCCGIGGTFETLSCVLAIALRIAIATKLASSLCQKHVRQVTQASMAKLG